MTAKQLVAEWLADLDNHGIEWDDIADLERRIEHYAFGMQLDADDRSDEVARLLEALQDIVTQADEGTAIMEIAREALAGKVTP